jgi:hypothetical protein
MRENEQLAILACIVSRIMEEPEEDGRKVVRILLSPVWRTAIQDMARLRVYDVQLPPYIHGVPVFYDETLRPGEISCVTEMKP